MRALIRGGFTPVDGANYRAEPEASVCWAINFVSYDTAVHARGWIDQ